MSAMGVRMLIRLHMSVPEQFKYVFEQESLVPY